MTDNIIKILIADDSNLVCSLLSSLFSKTPGFKVVGIAKDGEAVIEMAKQLKPDLITMDVMMPKLTGYEATERIMAECPTPILVLSSLIHEEELNSAVEALSAGALEAFPKFFDASEADFELKERQFLNMVRALSEVHVIRRVSKPSKYMSLALSQSISKKAEIVALGTSTGGPQALIHIFSHLKASFSVPIVVVLHISKGFLSGLVNWLQKISDLEICIAKDGEQLCPGKIYFAPDDYHLLIRRGTRPVAQLSQGGDGERFRPGVDQLFQSLSKSYPGEAIGGILTGMGRDGADGLLEMKKVGCYTFAQDTASCVVDGMPGAARAKGAVVKDVRLEEMPGLLEQLVKRDKEAS
ncbi:MAG: chemotaxis-specific protein-glutamate methyltransferase CheB [Legionellaceae bacterium]|nr:chemotaxis-specific protein-glutamate methyltransferase CheB [Legionellaceae bacterium]